MSVPYVRHGDRLTAAERNVLAAELDSVLDCLFNGKSPYAYGTGGAIVEGTKFYFGDSASWKILDSGAVSEYDQTALDATAAAMVVDDYLNEVQLARVNYVGTWPLDVSLKVHTREHPTYHALPPFYLAQWDGFQNITTRERFRKLDVAEIILESVDSMLVDNEWRWDSTWNKFHFLRFHNLDPVERKIRLDSETTFTLPPFGVRSVRRSYPAGGNWTFPFKYLWETWKKDPPLWRAVTANNVAALECYHQWLGQIETIVDAHTGGLLSVKVDPREVWNASPSPMPAVNAETHIAKFNWHTGRMIAWRHADAKLPIPVSLSLSWDDLIGGKEMLKLSVNTSVDPHELKIESTLGTSVVVDACGIGSTLLPVWPTTLPYTLDVIVPSGSGLFAAGVIPSADVTLSAQYYEVAHPPPGGPPITVTADTYTPRQWVGNGWTWTDGGAWDTIADRNVLTAGNGGELTTAPTVSWTCDGWRLVAHGAQTIPVSMEAAPDPEDGVWWEMDETGFTLPFGCDALGRSSYVHRSRKYGRVAKTYEGTTDLFDVVSYDGCPDVDGTNGIAGGIDWEENRDAQPNAEVTRTEMVPETWTTTRTLPVLPRIDAGERIVENYESRSWYNLNRTNLLAHTTAKEDRQSVICDPILAAHYNHVAARLNAVKGITPLEFKNMAYYGELDDGPGWPFDYYPQDFYCKVLSAGSRASDLGITPQSVTDGVTTAYYVTIHDVANLARQYKARFFHRRIVGYRLTLDDTPGFSQRTRSTAGAYTVERGSALLTRCTEDADGYFLAPPWGASAGGIAAECILGIEVQLVRGEAVDGWALDGSARLLTIPRPGVGWDNDPMTEPDATEFYEPMSAFAAPTEDAAIWPISSITWPITHASISALYGGTHDDRSIWEIHFIDRLFFTRT